MFSKKTILVAPLNWGLGHATRCVPIIKSLLNHKAEVLIAANGDAADLLKKHFPTLTHIYLPGYEVNYSSGKSQVLKMALQMPALIASIGNEQKELQKLAKIHHIDAVISDQRFGCYLKDKPSIIITHQVFPKTPLGEQLLVRQNHNWLKPFNELWIADDPFVNAAGSLSKSLPGMNSSFLGLLSRFSGLAVQRNEQFRCVAVVSGPEPQRQLLQEALLNQLQGIAGQHLLLTGKPNATSSKIGNVQLFGHLPDKELLSYLNGCELIVCRSGYSSIMDLLCINRSALLIPTPGQPEQEYLAKLHSGKGFLVQRQTEIDLAAALRHTPAPYKIMHAASKNTLVRALQSLQEQLNT